MRETVYWFGTLYIIVTNRSDKTVMVQKFGETNFISRPAAAQLLKKLRAYGGLTYKHYNRS